ncbi:MAG: amino acid adenylation domain-containing protein, partial [bacterium]|nr:amino acid adenylation domain-containing protein [bacterium]
YTSGSTGVPKGVLVEHRNLSAYLHAFDCQVGVTAGDVVIRQSSFTFDIFVEEFYPVLLKGGKLAIPSHDEIFDMDLLPRFITTHQVTLISTTPLFLDRLNTLAKTGKESLRSIRIYISGGDVLKPVNFDKLLELGIVYNGYGPTETTVSVTYHRCSHHDTSFIPIGKPLSNYKVYIRDGHGRLLPVGVPGEMCIGGPGVTRGYLNRPELTAEKFDKDFKDWQDGQDLKDKKISVSSAPPAVKLYKTGDLARWLPDGSVEFLGRIDSQVKIRGFRIELGEIESQLLNHPAVKETVVLAGEDNSGDKYLCAYLVPAAGEFVDGKKTDIEIPGLREHLSAALPGYMIPSYFIPIREVPLTVNGKVDREALPEPGLIQRRGKYTAPSNPLEWSLVHIWAGVLNMESRSIGIDTDFFSLGGHSLKAALMVSKIHKASNVKIPLSEVFKTPTIRELSQYIYRMTETGPGYEAVEPVETKEYYSPSPAQKRLYILQQMDKENISYNMPQVMKLRGMTDRVKIGKIFQRLIRRHESFRTSFMMLEGKPVQRIAEPRNLFFEIDYYELPVEKANDVIHRFSRPFDLSQPPLLRTALVKLGEESHILAVDMHHIVSDGVSHGVLARDFMDLYGGKKLPPLKLRYKDYAHWLGREEAIRNIEHQAVYWSNRLDGDIPMITLPIDYARPLVKRFEGEMIPFELEYGAGAILKDLALTEGVSLFMVLLAILNILLSKLSGEEDIIIGTATEGRGNDELRGIVGMFVNTLALRNFPRSTQTFREFLAGLKNHTLRDFEHQDYPFEDIVENLGVKRDVGRNPIFDVMFHFNNDEVPQLTSRGLELEPFPFRNKVSKFDLTLWGSDRGEELAFTFQYAARLFKSETIAIFIRYFRAIISAVTLDPNQELWEIRQMSRRDKQAILLAMNQSFEAEGQRFPPGGQVIQHRLGASLEKFETKIAVEYGAIALTYGELDKRSNRIANRLLARGINKGTFTGVLTENRISLILAIVGILKAGGGFVTLDTALPPDRLEYMIDSTGLELILTNKTGGNFGLDVDGETLKHRGVELTLIDDWLAGEDNEALSGGPSIPNQPVRFQPQDKIYIYFTSGSTGKPKAIAGQNIGLLHFIRWEIETLGIDETFNVSQLIAPGFDAFLRDLFVPLLTGSRLCIPFRQDIIRSSPELTRWLCRSRIHVMHCVPSLFRQLEINPSNCGNYKYLNYVLLSGEKINASDLIDWYNPANGSGNPVTFINLYGPTETTMTKTWHVIRAEDFERPAIPVGKPMPGVGIMVLDKDMNCCDPLVTGDIYICTPYSSHGYYNDPALNRQRFLENPFSLIDPKTAAASPEPSAFQTAKLYKTGDFGKMMPDGSLDLMGRNDRQVKVLGVRIQLEGVEAVFRQHPLVKEAVVVKKESETHHQWLCAYVTVTTPETFPDTMEAYLGEKLPAYMIPSQVLTLEAIPRTPAGKVDYPALTALEVEKEGYTLPANEAEQKLHRLWTGLFKRERIGTTRNFFALGGNSLSVIDLIARIEKEFDVHIPPADIFNNPTIQLQAKLVSSAQPARYRAVEPVEKRDCYPMSSAQKRLYFLHRMDMDSTGYNMPFVIPLGEDFKKEKPQSILKQLINRHESLRTSFEMIDGQPVQRVHDKVSFQFEYIKPETPDAGFIKRFVRPFDLSQAPLIRSALVRLADGNHIWLMDIHHIVSDGVSVMILEEEFLTLYKGEELKPRNLPLQYKDFALWRNHLFESDGVQAQWDYWLELYDDAGEIEHLQLPADYRRPPVFTSAGDRWGFKLDTMDAQPFKALSDRCGGTLYMNILAVLNTLFYRYTGQIDIVIGTGVAGRPHVDLERIIGMFVNLLAMRNRPHGEKTYESFLKEVINRSIDAFENQDVQFEELVDRLNVERNPSRNPLFDISMVVQNFKLPGEETRAPSARRMPAPVKYKKTTTKFDMTFFIFEDRSGLYITIEYYKAIFRKETIQRIAAHFKNIVKTIVRDPNRKLKDIGIISLEEKKQVLYEFNHTQNRFPKEKTIHQLLQEQVDRTPDRIALVGPVLQVNNPVVSITYKELNEQSHRLALLLTGYGVQPDTIVGIMVE